MKSNNQKEVWDAVAPEWEENREKPIKEVTDFLRNKSGKIADFGSGSGRHLIKLIDAKFFLIDFSGEMIKQAKKNSKEKGIESECIVSNLTKIPYENNFFDSAIYINSLHCIPSEEARLKSLMELYRTLKSGSEAMISVWNRNSKRIRNKPKDALIPWTVKGKKHLRYYYIYEKDELESLLKKVGFRIFNSWEDKNTFFIVSKP